MLVIIGERGIVVFASWLWSKERLYRREGGAESRKEKADVDMREENASGISTFGNRVRHDALPRENPTSGPVRSPVRDHTANGSSWRMEAE